MTELDAHSILVGARNLIERHGWVQCTAGNPEIGFCVVGAVRYAATGTVFGQAGDLKEVARALRPITGVRSEVEWNNTPGRTKEEVLAAFDRAISATAPSLDFSSLELELVS